jgi:predicted transcriptional regulator
MKETRHAYQNHFTHCDVCGNKMSTPLHALIDDVAVPERMETEADHLPTIPVELTNEERERRRYKRKARLLQLALEKADEMDKEQGLI